METTIITPAVDPTPAEEIQTDVPATEAPTLDVVADEIEGEAPAPETPKDEAPAPDPVPPVKVESEAAKALRLRLEENEKVAAQLKAELANIEHTEWLAATAEEFLKWEPKADKLTERAAKARIQLELAEKALADHMLLNPRAPHLDPNYVPPVVTPAPSEKKAKASNGGGARNLTSPTWHWRYKLTDEAAQYLIGIKDPEERANIEVRGEAGQYWGYFSNQRSDERHARGLAQRTLRDVLDDLFVVTTKETLVLTQ